MTGSPTNHRVTNAILSTKLDGLTDETRKAFATLHRRIDFMEEKLDIRISTNDHHCQENARDLAVLRERLKASTGILGTVQAIAFGVSTWLGTRF
jgi:hypothetical protein